MLKITSEMLSKYSSKRGPGRASVKDSVDFMPSWENIPLDFQLGRTMWNRLADDWYRKGLNDLKVVPWDGIDEELAITCVISHLKSWKVSEDHKLAGVAYMMASLFEGATWEVKE